MKGYKKGHQKLGGRSKGTPNKRTQQWEQFTEYCFNGGLTKFQRELEKLEGKEYVTAFNNILEFHKPKLQRAELTGELNVNNTITETTQFNLKKKG